MSSITAAKRRHSLLQQRQSEYPVVSENNIWKGVLLGAALPLSIAAVVAIIYGFNREPSTLPEVTASAPASVSPSVALEASPAPSRSRPAILFPQLRAEPRPGLDLQVVDLLSLRQQQFLADPHLQQPLSPPVEATQPLAKPEPKVAVTPAQAAATETVEPNDNKLQALFAEAVAATEDLNWQQASDQNLDAAPLLANASEDIRQKVPSVTFHSHIYSSDSTRRYVRLNDQRLQEGDWFSKNIELVAIRSDDIVLRVAGSLVRLPALRDWK